MRQIKHLATGAVIHESSTAATTREALQEAIASDADLSGADLSGAYLSGAYLSGAYLSGAYLSDADLSGADLSGADLSGADLSGADLSDAYLSDADLSGADLSDAYLSGADLSDAYLSGADLRGADLRGAEGLDKTWGITAEERAAQVARAAEPATERPERPARPPLDRAGRAARYRELHPEVPVVPHLDARILAAVGAEGEHLEMGQWHSSCGTTHCRAGWAITLAGDAGRDLEKRYDSERAGRMIYLASTGRTAYFYATNEDALADLRERAAADPLPAEAVSP